MFPGETLDGVTEGRPVRQTLAHKVSAGLKEPAGGLSSQGLQGGGGGGAQDQAVQPQEGQRWVSKERTAANPQPPRRRECIGPRGSAPTQPLWSPGTREGHSPLRPASGAPRRA